MKDWTGNSNAIFGPHGASNHSDTEREENDYYATPPIATELLLENEKFHNKIWENAVGEGHIAKVLENNGYKVLSSDIIDRNYLNTRIIDFLSYTPSKGLLKLDIITNPPYKYALEFCKNSLDVIEDGYKVAMFLKISFLEGKKRKELFKKYPPKIVYVFSGRVECGKNGKFTNEDYSGGAVGYAWYVWEKGFKGDPIIKWIN